MKKKLENTIILTRMDKPLQESDLLPNEYKVMEHWKVSYVGSAPTEHPRGEIQRYREIINGINSIRGDEPKKITISF